MGKYKPQKRTDATRDRRINVPFRKMGKRLRESQQMQRPRVLGPQGGNSKGGGETVFRGSETSENLVEHKKKGRGCDFPKRGTTLAPHRGTWEIWSERRGKEKTQSGPSIKGKGRVLLRG